jgi:hypothetical protein
MIELANTKNASRSFQRAAANDGDAGRDARLGARARSGHAWPFLSRYAVRPGNEKASDKPAANDSGS